MRPTNKNKYRHEVENYTPVSILNAFSRIYEGYIQNSLIPFEDNFLSVFNSACRQIYSWNQVLVRLIENWKQSLGKNKFISNDRFDCILHKLLTAKMHAYGFDLNSLIFFYSYLENRKQNVKINNTYSVFQVLLSSVPQESVLGPILFNIFCKCMPTNEYQKLRTT